MMTFNEKHRLVFPLVSNSRDYAKLYEYFGKLRGSKIEVLQVQGDFGENLAGQIVPRVGKQRLQSKMEVPKRRFLKWET